MQQTEWLKRVLDEGYQRGTVKDDERLVAFCEQEYPGLLRMLTVYCGNAWVAAELTQETLVRVWARWGRVRGLDDPSGWARRVAINLANSHFRRQRAERRARHVLRMEAPPFFHDPDEATRISIRDAIVKLPKRQRQAVVLHYVADLPFSEVARVMDAPEGTVRSLASRGVARLRSDSFGISEQEIRHAT